MSSARPLLPRLLLLLFSTLLCLGLVEAGFRLSGYVGLETMTGGRELALHVSDDPELVYELTPGAEGYLWGCDISINSGGFRDREYTLQKPDGVTRILAIGDSITFGIGLPVSETWSSVLESNLSKRNTGTEVLNFGVGGYDLAQSVRFLETTGMAYDPDHVILAYCMNDLATVSFNLEAITRLEQQRTGFLAWSRAAQWLALRPSREQLARGGRQQQRDEQLLAMTEVHLLEDPALTPLVARIQSALDEVPEDTGSESGAARRHLEWYTELGHIQRIRDGFARLAELAAAEGFSVSFCVVPYLDEAPFEDAWGAAYAIVGHLGRAAGLEVVDVRPEMVKLGLSKLKKKPSDSVHPSAVGHRAMARAIYMQSSIWEEQRAAGRQSR